MTMPLPVFTHALAQEAEIATDQLFDLVTAEITRLCHPIRPIAQATQLADIPELDSFKLVELVLHMERTLGREVDFARLEHLQCVQDVVAAFRTIN